MSYAFSIGSIPALPIEGQDQLFPVRRIFCVGRNYAAHTREMGGDPDRETPFFFMKPAEAVVPPGTPVPYPMATRDLHHEVELVVALKSGQADIAAEDALSHVFGYGVGVDLTRRDLQKVAKDKRQPWASAKAFDHSAPCSTIKPFPAGQPITLEARIAIAVNGEVRQDATLSHMIWTIPEIIAHLSRLFELKSGDLIFTGTPAGVAALRSGDQVTARIEGLPELNFEIT